MVRYTCKNLNCKFDTKNAGQRATRITTEECPFCNQQLFREDFVNVKKRAALLRKFRKFPVDIQREAMTRIPLDMRAPFGKEIAKTKYCQGRHGEACDFAACVRGGPVKLNRKKKTNQCTLCGPKEILASSLETVAGMAKMRRDLSKMKPEARLKAMLLIPKEKRKVLETQRKKV